MVSTDVRPNVKLKNGNGCQIDPIILNFSRRFRTEVPLLAHDLAPWPAHSGSPTKHEFLSAMRTRSVEAKMNALYSRRPIE